MSTHDLARLIGRFDEQTVLSLLQTRYDNNQIYTNVNQVRRSELVQCVLRCSERAQWVCELTLFTLGSQRCGPCSRTTRHHRLPLAIDDACDQSVH